MTNRKQGRSFGLPLFLLVICLAGPLQGFMVHGFQERILNSQDGRAARYKTLTKGNEADGHHSEKNNIEGLVSLGYADRSRRNLVDDAKQTVKSTTEKLSWVKKNFHYLLLMVGSIFFLFFSCAIYRRLTRDRDDEDSDDVRVVVIGGPKDKSSATGTSSSCPPINIKGTKETSNSVKTKKSSIQTTKMTKKNTNTKTTRMKGERKKQEPKGLKESDSNSRSDDDDYDSSDSEYNLLVREYGDVVFSDFMNERAVMEGEHWMKRGKESLFNALLDHKKKPFSQIRIDACVINGGIPLSSYTSFQQSHPLETELKVCEPTTQYVEEIRERAELLYGKRQVTRSTTSYSQYPVLDDLELLNERLVVSSLEKCGHYLPKASTNTRLPITATVN